MLIPLFDTSFPPSCTWLTFSSFLKIHLWGPHHDTHDTYIILKLLVVWPGQEDLQDPVVWNGVLKFHPFRPGQCPPDLYR